jgi:hypothetical protein
MTERVNIGKDVERPVGKTKGRTVERTGIPGRAGNDGDESWNDGEKPTGKTRGRTVESEKEVRMKSEER